MGPVWPDWAIFCTLGNFLNLPKSLTFLGNFCKGVKIYQFFSEIIFEQLLQTFGDFFLVTLDGSAITVDPIDQLWRSIWEQLP